VTVNGLAAVSLTVSGTTVGASQLVSFYINSGTSISASYGQTWANSIFLSLVSGSNNATYTLLYTQENNSGGSFITNGNGSVFPASFARYVYNRTISSPSANYVVSNYYQQWALSGTAVNETFLIAAPQLEFNPNIPATVASAVTAASGTGGVNGSGVYTVTGGTCTTQPTLNTTWAAGVLTVNSVANAGSCSVLPPSPATLAYASGTATGWTGATVTLTPTDNSAQAFATSPILTSGSAATRAADNVSIGVAPGAASLWVSGTPNQPTSSPLNQTGAVLTNGINNTLSIFRSTSGYGGAYSITNNTPTATLGGVIASGASAKLSTIVAGTTLSLVINNGAPSTASQAAGPANNLPTLYIGSFVGNVQQWNGYISRVVVSSQSLLPY
jgi:hypothetical protein